METLLEGSFPRLYNCNYSIEQVPLEQRQKILLGSLSIALFFIFEVLYIPCIFAIWRHLEQSCYKIMFAIGISDILGLFVPGLLTGILGIRGMVFCSSPWAMFLLGMFGNAVYYFETAAATLLAANRCLEMGHPRLAASLFGGHKTWCWIGLISLYTAFFVFKLKPTVFSSIDYIWYFNPHFGYLHGVGDQYKSVFDIIHEILVAVQIPLFYALFALALSAKEKEKLGSIGITGTGGTGLKSKKIIFLQVFLLSSLNATIACCYLMMAFVRMPPAVGIICGTFGWELVHGLPPVIYLGINRTLRQDCAHIFRHAFGRRPTQNKVALAPSQFIKNQQGKQPN